jgi:hypothetical protein
MELIILDEAGHEWALAGTSLSFKDEAIPFRTWWSQERYIRMQKTCKGMAFKDGGHNKFLESMQLWIFIKAPRGWWQEMDTYRAGVTKNSASTMHTIQKRPVTLSDFEEGTDGVMVNMFNDILVEVTDNFTNTTRLKGEKLQRVKWNMPEGYLQSRIVNLNYKTLRNIFLQRWTHNLEQWQFFINEIRGQCQYVDYLPSKLSS